MHGSKWAHVANNNWLVVVFLSDPDNEDDLLEQRDMMRLAPDSEAATAGEMETRVIVRSCMG